MRNCTVTAASNMSGETYEYLCEKVRRRFGDDIAFTRVTDDAVIGGFMQLGAKVLVALLGARVFLHLDVVWLAWPISFAAGTVFPFLVYRKRFQGVSDAEPASEAS